MIFKFEEAMLENYEYAVSKLSEAIENRNAVDVAYYNGFRQCVIDTMEWIRAEQRDVINKAIDTGISDYTFKSESVPVMESGSSVYPITVTASSPYKTATTPASNTSVIPVVDASTVSK